ncbi:MAG: exodeoxyribonuclease VII small subunit [Bacteroidia bacterium]|nr:exodeoxyribonuclease VII small subunit [Bacteroidia bacterium]MDW8158992.1 exodeoxyribonuclease VII small subunit [Bacteroidia bacterium]
MSDNFSYEQSILRIQDILSRLQNQELNFEESLALYGEAIKLIKNCEEFVRNAELKIEQISIDSTGEIQITNFQP